MDSNHVDEVIERALAGRDVPAPPAAFTAGVMARVVRERWQAERVIDIGFNVAMAAGVLFILAGGAGLAWSFGVLTVPIDFDFLLDLTRAQVSTSVITQIQTVATAAVLLTIALVLWWWAEADSSY
jgi:hypothetical protein